MTFNRRHGKLGMITWPGMVLFEYLAPSIESIEWFVVPLALFVGALNPAALIWLLLVADGMGLLNSLIALLLDKWHDYFNSPTDPSRLVTLALIENFGLRLTVWWRDLGIQES